MTDIFALFKQIEKKDSAPATPPTHMVVGLGNPGKEYALTRHNAGFRAVDFLTAEPQTDVTHEKFHALFGIGNIGKYRILFLKPLTFMNSSGEAVREAADFYKIPPENILVLVDDIYLDAGRMRVRANGSDGGHNGLKSIIYQLGADTFPRIRLGVGKKPTPEYDLADWVLSKMDEGNEKRLEACFPLLAQAIELVFDGKADLAMGLCNGFRADAPQAQEKEKPAETPAQNGENAQ